MEKINFNFVKGDTYSRGFTIEGFEFPITQVYFTVKEKSTNKNYVIQKRLTKGIELDPEVPNRYVLTIDADDTNNMKTNFNYVFDIQIVGDSIKRTIIGGYLKLDDWDITSKENEV
jgi:hypothetical protein